ncbi:hypothetical protein FQN54_006008 [Arachnomyces sp. PD_36]|nr:hypothetical protein FQN54_006008 [Arachnomyces sp. PD_36]
MSLELKPHPLNHFLQYSQFLHGSPTTVSYLPYSSSITYASPNLVQFSLLRMPTEEEFEAFYQELLGKGYGPKHRAEICKERWQENFLHYRSWEFRRNCEMVDNDSFPRYSQNEDPGELIASLASGNFARDDNAEDVRPDMWWPLVPIIPLGIDSDNIRYRIIPNNLRELFEDQKPPSVQGELIDYHIMGVNTNVQPAQPEEPYPPSRLGLPPKSTDLNEFDDWQGGGFVFYHLGYLETWSGPEESWLQGRSRPAREWDSDNWNVVIRLSSDGTPGGIYVIYDMYPPDDLIDERGDAKIEGDHWGFFPNAAEYLHPQFSMAKVADDIRQLGFDYKLNLTEVVEHPVEIVRAVKTLRGTIVRTTVSRNPA